MRQEIVSWPAQIASSQKIRDVQISPDGSMILYQVQPFYRADRTLSNLWLAESAVSQSARPLTRGTFNDRSGVFHPDGRRIVFLSDRHNAGKGAILFLLALDDEDGDDLKPIPLSANFGRKGVQAFEISPNGEFIAFTSADEASHDKGTRGEEGNDARVVGGTGTQEGFSRLRLYSFSTGEIVTLEGVRKDRHVEAFCWSPNSSRLLYRLRQGRGPEFGETEVNFESILVKDSTQVPRCLGTYPRSPSGRNICTPSGLIASLQSYEPFNILDARTLFVHQEAAFVSGEVHRLYGVKEDAIRIVNAGIHPSAGGAIAVEVCSKTNTHIDIVFLENPTGAPITVFRTQGEAIWFGAWDAKMMVDEGQVSYVVAAVLSSGIRHEPPNVWTCRVSADGQEKSPRLQLSSHLQWLSKAPAFTTHIIRWQSSDGTLLDGIIRYPPGYHKSEGPRPTILFLHGGPYRRDIPGQGRGHEFAHAASRGVGVYDWADCESMVDEVIRRGLADPERLGVAGWSHGSSLLVAGGSLTAWGVTKTKNRFKAAIVGAGVSNWEGMVMDSGSPELETEIGQSAPWDCDGQERSIRKTSPIHCVAGVTTAVLILHGEKDERVPVGQAIGLWRGLKRRASERAKEAAQLVLYPREPHG
ncbi:hypothetical protein H0H87_006991 [Tephrocybe sp. NHM501043]|nr:hypothetical protein H0H87_006991 [Tephrocybe sp. NHM501043]